MTRWDDVARRVCALPDDAFRDRLDAASKSTRADLIAMRLRWDLHRASHALVRPVEARRGTWSPPGRLDALMYDEPLLRPGARDGLYQHLILASRGIGKTTRLRTRFLVSALYCIHPASLFVGGQSGDATASVQWIRDILDDPPPVMAAGWPELRTSGTQSHLVVETRFGTAHILARGWASRFRGLNLPGAGRPTQIGLDDVESEENSRSQASRDGNADRLRAKILPLVPLGSGAELWWCQTPAHHDATAARILRRDAGHTGWTVTHCPAVLAWPERSDLWGAAEAVYRDASHASTQDAVEALTAFYRRHREAMDAGADLLDPHRLPILDCYRYRWDRGPSAFDREYQVAPRTASGRVFDTSAWPRIDVDLQAGTITRHDDGETIPIRTLRLAAHYDPSDGGDDGSVSVVGCDGAGRRYEIAGRVMATVKNSEQLPQVAAEVAPLVRHGLRVLMWEPPSGAASTVERQLRAALRAEAKRLSLRPVSTMRRPSHENKNARIVGGLEGLAAARMLYVRHDTPQGVLTTADDFDPSTTDNRDDWLDGLERASTESGRTTSTGPRLHGSVSR